MQGDLLLIKTHIIGYDQLITDNNDMIQKERLLQTFLTLLKINSYYPDEEEVMQVLRAKLTRVGMTFSEDQARNLLGTWAGTGNMIETEPVLLCAHVDTVRPTIGMEPIVRDGRVWSDGSSVLGADDKAAVAAIVEAIESIADQAVDHPPVEVLFTVGEDIGHIGSKAFDVATVQSKLAFIPDSGGPVGQIIIASPWSQSLKVKFHGRAAHAGIEPENGQNALLMAARAIASLPWGQIDDQSTANIGTVVGGEAANIVAPEAEMVVQIRSLSQQKHLRYIDDVLQACTQAAADLGGSMEHEVLMQMSGFEFETSDPIVQRAISAIESTGRKPSSTVSCGGSDANELNAKGLKTLVLSVGYEDIHSNQEAMPLDELNALTDVCTALILQK